MGWLSPLLLLVIQWQCLTVKLMSFFSVLPKILEVRDRSSIHLKSNISLEKMKNVETDKIDPLSIIIILLSCFFSPSTPPAAFCQQLWIKTPQNGFIEDSPYKDNRMITYQLLTAWGGLPESKCNSTLTYRQLVTVGVLNPQNGWLFP